jgi:DNA-binding response OmpR family regulator
MKAMSNCTVLVVEDDTSIRRGLADALEYAGYSVLQCADGKDAAQMTIGSSIDLVLLDVMLPGRDGFSILQELRRARPTLPVIMVTARGAESDRVRGLSDGADDYVVKPFSALELLARVEAVLRRSPARPADVHALEAPECVIDLERREAILRNGIVHQLSQREADMLRFLAANRGRAIDRNELIQHVWGLNPRGLETRTVDMQIARLREKLREGSADTSIIQTVRGKGYMLADSVKVQ